MERSRLFGLLTTAAYAFAFVIYPVFSAPEVAYAEDCAALQANATAVQTSLDTQIGSLQNMASGNSGDMTATNASGMELRSQYFGRIRASTSAAQNVNTALTKLAQGGCGEADFRNRVAAFQGKVETLNNGINLANTKLLGLNPDKLAHGAPNYQPSVTPESYQGLNQNTLKAQCSTIIGDMRATQTIISNKLNEATAHYNQYQINKTTASHEAQQVSYQQAVTAQKQMEDKAKAGIALGCNDPAKAGDLATEFNTALEAGRTLTKQGQELATKLGEDASSWGATIWNTVLDSAAQIDSCGCGDLTKSDGIVNGIFNRAIWLTICTISVALGVIACFIIGNLIDPVFGEGSATCTPNPDGSAPAAQPSTSASPGASPGTSPGTSPPPGSIDLTPLPGAPTTDPIAA